MTHVQPVARTPRLLQQLMGSSVFLLDLALRSKSLRLGPMSPATHLQNLKTM